MPLVPPTPDWVGSPSADAIFLSGPADLTISDLHFDGIVSTNAIGISAGVRVIIERCTFSNIDQAINIQASTDVTIRNCAFWNINTGGYARVGGHHILLDGCDTVVVEDCWFYDDPAISGISDTINMHKTNNGIVRRCCIMGTGTHASNAAIIVGDGDDAVNGGGDNLLIEDNVVIDGTVGAIGTNCVVRRNVVLMRGLVPAQDGKLGAMATDSGSYPGNPIGPIEVSENEVFSYNSTGTPDPFPITTKPGQVVTGLASNPIHPLIDEYSRWNITGYYGA